MFSLSELGKAINEIVEPKIHTHSGIPITKVEAQRYINYLENEDGYGWNKYQAKLLYAEFEKRAVEPISIEKLYEMAKYNYPKNPMSYLPIILIFYFFFGMLAFVLW